MNGTLAQHLLCSLVCLCTLQLAQGQTDGFATRSEKGPLGSSGQSTWRYGGSYELGPEDVLTFHVRDGEEFANRQFRIDGNGYLYLPLVGRVRAAGMTVEELRTYLDGRLREYIREPEVVVEVVQFRSQPVSVFGAVNNPGVIQVEGRKTLLEVLSMAGGVRQDAADKMKITRRVDMGPLPLPGAQLDETRQFEIAEVDLSAILEARNPAANILVKPFDVITVPRARLVYVIGEVNRPGGFVIDDDERISALTALSLAQGFTKLAKPAKARILRVQPQQTSRLEIPVDLEKIVRGRGEDIPLQPDDILVVPSSSGRQVLDRITNTGLGILTGVIVWRR